MALAALLTTSPGLSSHPLRCVAICENSGPRLEQVACSVVCASQSRILVKTDRVRRSGRAEGKGRKLSSRRRDKVVIFAVADENNDDGGSSSSSDVDVEALESRLGLGRRARREGGESKPRPPPPPPSQSKQEKKWEEMSLLEQAWSLYIGEKGVLFWLNKLAYASIFILIAAWIVFRFVGPSLGWYELDSPLLPPDQLLG